MAYSDEVLADSPLLYWRLGESAGTTAEDTTANNRDGTYAGSGVTYSQAGALVGDANTAVTFNGTAGEVRTAAAVSPGTNIVTLECWANFPSFNNTDDLLFETSVNYNITDESFICDPCGNEGSWQINMRGTAGAGGSYLFTRPSTGVFHHYVFVYDKSTTTKRFVVYVDTVVQSLTVGSTPSITTGNFGNHVLYVGSRAGTSLFLNATVDEVAFYAGELSASRVTAHYLAGITGPTALAFQPHLRW